MVNKAPGSSSNGKGERKDGRKEKGRTLSNLEAARTRFPWLSMPICLRFQS